MKIAIVGATGLVGNLMLKILEERNFPVTVLLPVASEKSVGLKQVSFKGKMIDVISVEEAIAECPDLALFSAGGNVSLQYAEKFARFGTVVIDNSSAWRMDSTKKLIIPEINGSVLQKSDKIIANPNCSTIQMLMVLAPLHAKYKIKRLVISTYQSVSGTGMKALQQFENEKNNIEGNKVYPYPIYKNCLPQCDDFLENGYTKEEMKLVNETHKILDAQIEVTATAVRVPVSGGHSEAVNIEFANDFTCADIRILLSETQGVMVQDNPAKLIYPMPLFAEGKNDVFVGRIRKDLSQAKTLNLWVVADNLRKGAALNAVQIAEMLLQKGF